MTSQTDFAAVKIMRLWCDVTHIDDLKIGDIDVSRNCGVAVLIINRPEKLNALTRAFWFDLRKTLDIVTTDGVTGAVVLSGAGTKSFSVGGDIHGFASIEDLEELKALQREAMAGFISIELCPLMVVAAVNGYAFGGGCELVLACDWAIAADNAVFAMPEASLGLLPGFGVVRAPDVIGRRMAKLMLATGEKIDATRAHEIGLVQNVVPAEALLSEAIALAKRVVRNSPTALKVGKRIINHRIDQTLIDYSVEAVTQLQCSADRREGVSAFLEKRSPDFYNRGDA